MKKIYLKSFIILSILSVFFISMSFGQQTIVFDYKILLNNKEKIENKEVKAALNKLLKDADKILTKKPLTVTSKTILPPSKNKHDYLSRAPYWWPNPNTKNGLPYIPKDGQNNPERLKIKDLSYLIEMAKGVKILGLAYFFTGDEKYSNKLEELVKVWFINPNSKMNPNLNYGQSIPGIKDGRIEGVIDTKYFIDVIDGVLLAKKAISQESYNGVLTWFKSFDDWLENSKIGKQGTSLKNNIGTAYLMQRVTYLRFLGNDNKAISLLKEHVPRLMKIQFDKDGEQILENKRTKSWSYNLANLKYWFNIAKVGEDLNLDVWNYTMAGSHVIDKSYNGLAKIANGEKSWNKAQISAADFNATFASLKYTGDRKFSKKNDVVFTKNVNSIILLTEHKF